MKKKTEQKENTSRELEHKKWKQNKKKIPSKYCVE